MADEDEDFGQGDKPADEQDFGQGDKPAEDFGEGDKPAERAWSDVPLEAVKNIPSSAYHLGEGIYQTVAHPIETAQNLGAIGGGVLQYLGAMGGEEYKPYAAAVGQMLKDRYGGTDAIKNALATDPVGVAADVSMILSGGAMAAGRVPSLAGALSQAARYTDPLAAAGRVAGAVGRGVGRTAAEMAGVTTHVGPEPFMQAAKAGYEGGQAGKEFRENVTGRAPASEAVEEAGQAVEGLQRKRAAEYQAGMTQKIDPLRRQLNLNQLGRALQDITRDQVYRSPTTGQQFVTNKATEKVRNQIFDKVSEWAAIGDRSPSSLDALKKAIYDIRDTTQYGTPERLVTQRASNAINQTLKKAVPDYAEIMSGYQKASQDLHALQTELSLSPEKIDAGRIDTALRKLQSTLRNNVNTSFTRRRELAQFLVDNGAPNLMYKLAGQALQPYAPRGLGRLGLQIGSEMVGILGLTGLAPAAIAPMVAAAITSSPRLMGEASYLGGRAAGIGARAAQRLPGGLGRPTAAVGRLQRTSEGLPFYQAQEQEEEPSADRAPMRRDGGAVDAPGSERTRRKVQAASLEPRSGLDASRQLPEQEERQDPSIDTLKSRFGTWQYDPSDRGYRPRDYDPEPDAPTIRPGTPMWGEPYKLQLADGGTVKKTKAAVHYEKPSQHKGQRCMICSMFRRPNGCTAVDGHIYPTGWCELFDRK